MIYCTSLHFLRHEQWRTDRTGSEKHHVFMDKASTGTPHQTTHSSLSPGAPLMRGWRFQKKGPNAWFMSCCFRLSRSALSTGYSVFFFINSLDFGFLHSAPLILLSEEGVDFFILFYYFFKEHGCSKTERIQTWLGALSNALLKVHYKDE